MHERRNNPGDPESGDHGGTRHSRLKTPLLVLLGTCAGVVPAGVFLLVWDFKEDGHRLIADFLWPRLAAELNVDDKDRKLASRR